MQCPQPQVLQQLIDESLPAEQQAVLQSHLETCTFCQTTIERLVAGGVTWDKAAQNLGAKPAQDETALLAALEKLQNASTDADQTRAEAGTAPADEVLSFLQPSQKPGSLGRLDDFEILSVVGKGGFGIVLKAFDETLHRIVAIKVMAPQIAASGAARQRFTKEAKAAAAITHENVVTIHAVGKDPKVPYLVMQFVSGVTLGDKIEKCGALGLKEILRIGMQTAEGLAAAHKQGVVHRDIKPGNILLENGVERVKITDFGLARAADDASVTQSGTVAGTPMYMSPEQANGEHVDQRSDLFSLGSVLYVMATGRPPFRATSTMAVMKRVCDDTPTPVQEVNAEIPDWLGALIAKLHAKKPGERFQTAQEVAEVLGQELARVQQPTVATYAAPTVDASAMPMASSPVAPVSGSPRRRRLRAALITTVAILVTCTLGYMFVPRVRHAADRVVRFASNKSALIIEANDEDLEVSVKQEDKHFGKGMLVRKGTRGLVEMNVGDGEFIVRELPARVKTKTMTYSLSRGEHQTLLAKDFMLTPDPVGRLTIINRDRVWDAEVALISDKGVILNKFPVYASDSRYVNQLAADEYRVLVLKKKVGTPYPAAVLADKPFPHHYQYRVTLRPGGRETVELPPEEPGWVQLFNGTDLTGWTVDPRFKGTWKVDKGAIIGDGGVLKSTQLFANFHCRLEVKMNTGGDGEFGFRAAPDNLVFTSIGSKFDVGGTGSLRHFRRGGEVLLVESTKKLADEDSWVTLEVVADGKKVTVKVNGTTTAEKVIDGMLERGYVDLAVGRPGSILQVRKIEIKELPPEPTTPELLRGSWTLENAEVDGKPLPDGAKFRLEIRFGERDFEMGSADSPERLQGTFRIDPVNKQLILEFVDKANPLQKPAEVPCPFRIDGKRLSIDFPKALLLRERSGKIEDGTLRVEFQRREPIEPGWVQLFNGKDYSNWETPPAGIWKIENGLLSGILASGFMRTKRSDYRDFHLRMEVQYTGEITSFLNFRCYHDKISLNGYGVPLRTSAGTLNVVKQHAPIPLSGVAPSIPAETWHQLEVIAVGNRLITKVNGQTIADLKDDSHAEGFLALNSFHPKDGIRFRKIEIKELPPPAPPGGPFALLFDAKASVSMPTLKYAQESHLTIEAFVTPTNTDKPGKAASVVGYALGNPFNGLSLWDMKKDWGFGGYTPSPVMAKGPREKDRRVHLAGVRAGGRLLLFVNGKKFNEVTPANLPFTNQAPFGLGGAFEGIISEVRVSKTARYDGDFKPELRLVPDADTLALYHFDEGQGDVLKDSSGNKHHGKIVGAKWVKADGSQIKPPLALSALDREDLGKLKGEWVVNLGEIGAKPLPLKEIDKLEIRLGDNDFEIRQSGKKPQVGALQIESAKKQLLLYFKDNQVPVRCSYRFDGPRLRLDFAGLLSPGAFDEANILRLADRVNSRNNLRQLAVAMHAYHDTYKALPPAALTNVQAKDGKPLLSWRVALLPFLDQEKLHKSFKLDEPWDSPHNKKLIAQMPAIFAAPGIKTKEPDMTHYQVFVGPGTAFEPHKDRQHGIRFGEIQDGTSNTLMIVEAAEAIFWTKPDDLPFDPKQPLGKLGVYGAGIHIAQCDATVRTLSPEVSEKALRALITRNGREADSAPFLQPDPPQGPPLYLELLRGAEFQPLFNGKDLIGWTDILPKSDAWRVEDGILEAKGKLSTLVSTTKHHGDFHLRMELMSNADTKAYMVLRSNVSGTDGYQMELGIARTQRTPGSILRELPVKRGRSAADGLVEPNEWFTLEVIAKGNRFIVKQNGKDALDWIDDKWLEERGAIALVQDARCGLLKIRKLEIKALPAADATKLK